MMTGEAYFTDALKAVPEDIGKRVDWSMAISTKIADAIASRGETQKEFAKEMGKTEAEVSRWLGGTHNFTLSTLAKISVCLGIDLIKAE